MSSAASWIRRVVGIATMLGVAAGLVQTRAAAPEEWSRFRGPNGSGIAETADLPLTFGPGRT